MTPQASTKVESSAVAMTPEEERRVAHWRDVLEGRAEPDYLPITAEDEAFVRAEEATFPGPITKGARRRILLDAALWRCYEGQPVVCLYTPDGCAVLAAGVAEVALFQRSMPAKHLRRTRVEYLCVDHR